MAFRVWQVGLDIDGGAVRALALQRRRGGWQLRHWWQQRLPSGAGAGDAWPPEGLGQMLTEWRRRLPGRISLRVSFPIQRVMHRRIGAPDGRLREPERGWYVASQFRRRLSDVERGLVMDYRRELGTSGRLLVTAARQEDLRRWLACLEGAGLRPEVLDIAPCALRYMAGQAGLAPNLPLVHAMADGWCWGSALAQPLNFGFIAAGNGADFHTALRLIARHGEAGPVQAAYFSSESRMAAPAGALAWSPLRALWQAPPPLPAWPPAFAIACGLALRPEDQ